MAAKRISQSAIDWAALASRVPQAQKPQFLAFKTKSDVYVRAMNANPKTPPNLNWEYYKRNLSNDPMVDEFKTQYEALKIPYPKDNMASQVEAQVQQTKADIAEFKKQSDSRIAEYQQRLNTLNAQIPVSQMTMEEYYDAVPELALDPLKRPTFWPHQEDELAERLGKTAPTPPPAH